MKSPQKSSHDLAYTSELEGQVAFFKTLGIDHEVDTSHNTDGVWRGNLFEHKLSIPNIDRVLFQAIKYASRIRERGERLPANLVLNDLNGRKAYIFKSADFLPDIEKVYFGAASKDNDGFHAARHPETIGYADFAGQQALRARLNTDACVPCHVDRNNILGLAEQFYQHHPHKNGKELKDLFLDGARAEIRRPTVLADRIIPYAAPGNEAFADIMDCLNPALLQREIGAFYTPQPYVDRMHEMLRAAIAEVPAGMDYIIIDRCAGVGNLQRGLPDDILAHCALSTIEPNEYQLLRREYGDKCAVVVPNTDALAYDIIPAEVDAAGAVVNDYIREKVTDPNCAVILVENPPYSEVAGGAVQKSGRKTNAWKRSWVHQQMQKAVGTRNGSTVNANTVNDLANLFIWSGFRYYLTKPQDAYILYSPTKYWRNQGLVRKRFRDGFLCNRKEFHATPSTIGCLRWKNVDDTTTDRIPLDALAVSGAATVKVAAVTLRQARTLHSKAYDRTSTPPHSSSAAGVLCEMNGAEFKHDGRKVYLTPVFSPDIIGYLNSSTFSVDFKHVSLTRCAWAGGHGFHLRRQNFIEKLPLFVAAIYPCEAWWERDTFSKTYDGNGSYISDRGFLKRCLLHAALTPKNKCRSFLGSDGRFYRNELCLAPGTDAQKALDGFIAEGLKLTNAEKALLGLWEAVRASAEDTEECQALMIAHPDATLGTWQIQQEMNIKVESDKVNPDGSRDLVFKYPALNTAMGALAKALKDYYKNLIAPALFRYELLK